MKISKERVAFAHHVGRNTIRFKTFSKNRRGNHFEAKVEILILECHRHYPLRSCRDIDTHPLDGENQQFIWEMHNFIMQIMTMMLFMLIR